MNADIIKKYSIRYNLPEEELEILLPLSNELDLHIYDVKILYDKYNKDIEKVKKHKDERSFIERTRRWLDDKYKIKNTIRFKQSAEFFKKHKKYTNYIKNKHKNSDYYKFWKEEARRCIFGYLNGDEWITGYHYFYLNYTPIELVKTLEEVKGNKQIQGERVVDFPFFWDGDYFYFHYLEEAERHGLSANVLKTRGRGYSWKAASMMNRNFYLIPNSNSVVFTADEEFLTGGDGILSKTWSQMAFLDDNTDWAKKKQKKDSEHHKRASYIVKQDGKDVEKGFFSEIIGKTLGNNVNKARGKRAKLILFEEAGSFKDLTTAWIITKPSVRQGRITYGLRVAFGTGGDTTVGFEGLRKMFYSPEAYNIYGVPNFWTKGQEGKIVGWFHPEYINREGYYDEDGNSYVYKALDDILAERDKLVNSNADLDTILRNKAEQPIIPEEAILRLTGSPFPTTLLKEQIIRLETEGDLNDSDIGRLTYDGDGKLKWINDTGVKIINSRMASKDNRIGGIEIYEHPKDIIKQQPFGYIIGVDPIDFDYTELSDRRYSLGSAFVMNTISGKIVAEYTGRPDLADTFYETVRRLAIYYNASVMYENNIKGLYVYFVNRYSEHLLAPRPKILDDDNTYLAVGKRKYGYTKNNRIEKVGLQFIKKWLTEPLDEEGELLRLHTIKSKGLLEELIEWNPDGNFDRINAMIALMIFYKDIERMIDENFTVELNDQTSKFFKKPFSLK